MLSLQHFSKSLQRGSELKKTWPIRAHRFCQGQYTWLSEHIHACANLCACSCHGTMHATCMCTRTQRKLKKNGTSSVSNSYSANEESPWTDNEAAAYICSTLSSCSGGTSPEVCSRVETSRPAKVCSIPSWETAPGKCPNGSRSTNTPHHFAAAEQSYGC